MSVEGPARSEHRRARNLQIITGHGFWRSDSDAVPDATCNCARLATDGSRPASPAFEEGLSQRAGALPGGGMRDLPGFYWDEERQRYFALAQENVARDLSRCDPRRVSAHDEPAHIRADAFVFLSDANNRIASTCPRRDRTHLGANAPENRRRSGKGASSSRVRDPPGDGSRRKKKRGGERARERGADASSRRDPFSSSRRGVAAPSERKPKDAQKQPGPSREKTRHPRSTLCARARSGWRSAARTCAVAGSRALQTSSPPRARARPRFDGSPARSGRTRSGTGSSWRSIRSAWGTRWNTRVRTRPIRS